MEMEDQYGIADLRQFISRAAAPPQQAPPATQFPLYTSAPPPQQPPSELFPTHQHHRRQHDQQHHQTQFDMLVMGRQVGSIDMLHNHHYHHHQANNEQFNSDSTTTTATANANCGGFDGGDGSTTRWPRQETLTLLEIRSRLDHKFKESNQKGPLWDEVARIMSEEHRYQRSGKKCREKFENLYKYYKKTKEGKAGRQDGKHYRFFRQLEALYGSSTQATDTHIPGITPNFANNAQPNTSLSLSTSSDGFDTTSSEGDDMASMGSNGSRKKKRRGPRSNKAKIQDLMDTNMRKMMEKQEAWLEKMMKNIEEREKERMARDEEWRKQEAAWVEREQKFWAWIEARDSALLKALEAITNNQWPESEITRLIQVRTSLESRFKQCGFSEEVLWEDIATKMAYLGYERTAVECKEKWDGINKTLLIQEKSNHKRMFMNNNEGSSSPSSHNSNINGNAGNVINDSCFKFFLGDGESLGWENNYAVKLNKGAHQCP